MTVPIRSLAFALTMSIMTAPAVAAQKGDSVFPPIPAQAETLEELERKADELSETARRTIEDFVNLVGPMLTRLSRLIEGLPAYETPEILPNGDIIIRRKPQLPASPDTSDDGLTET